MRHLRAMMMSLAAVPLVSGAAAPAAVLPFLVMTEQQAARFVEATTGSQNRLEPRLVPAGPYKGRYVLPRRVEFDPAYVGMSDAFALLSDIQMDTDVAFPPEAD